MLKNRLKTEEPKLVLSQKDFERIRNHLNPTNATLEKTRKDNEERKKLHEMSVEQVKSWTNTLIGQRQANLEARSLRERNEEEQKVKLDIEEARIQGEKRKLAIEQAKMHQYFQTEKMKKFNNAVLMTETLHERKKQIEYKNAMRNAQMLMEKDDALKIAQDYEEFKRAEDEKLMEQYRRNKEMSELQKNQIQEKKIESAKEKDEIEKEAQKLSEEIESFKYEQQKIEHEKKLKVAKQKEEYLRQIELNKQLAREDLERQEKENESIRNFSLNKRAITKKISQTEMQIQKEKQKKLEELTKSLSFMRKKEDSYFEEKMQKDIEEEERKLALKEKEAQVKRELMKEAARKSYLEQEKIRQENADKKLQEDMQYLELGMKACADEAKKDEEIKRQKLKEARNLSSHHIRQMAERKNQEGKLADEDRFQEEMNKKLVMIEDKYFEVYNSKVIANLEKRGRNTNLLRVAAKKISSVN